MAPFYGWGSTASRLEPLRGGSLLFTTKFPDISGTHFTNLGRMKSWVNLGATQWFWTWDPWIWNPTPWPLGHCSHSPSKTMKNVFLFYLKALSVLKIFCLPLFFSLLAIALRLFEDKSQSLWRHQMPKRELNSTFCLISWEGKKVWHWKLIHW